MKVHNTVPLLRAGVGRSAEQEAQTKALETVGSKGHMERMGAR